MTAFRTAASGTVTVKRELDVGRKSALIRVKGPTAYETGGSAIDLSSASADVAAMGMSFEKVHTVECVGYEAAADDKYRFAFVPAASYAPATGKLKVRDLTAASDAEVTNGTDLSASVFVLRVTGT